jgi:hypothetical protein
MRRVALFTAVIACLALAVAATGGAKTTHHPINCHGNHRGSHWKAARSKLIPVGARSAVICGSALNGDSGSAKVHVGSRRLKGLERRFAHLSPAKARKGEFVSCGFDDGPNYRVVFTYAHGRRVAIGLGFGCASGQLVSNGRVWRRADRRQWNALERTLHRFFPHYRIGSSTGG